VIDHLTDAIALYDPKPVGVSNKISTGRCVRRSHWGRGNILARAHPRAAHDRHVRRDGD
jgi:hypothetical protein